MNRVQVPLWTVLLALVWGSFVTYFIMASHFRRKQVFSVVLQVDPNTVQVTTLNNIQGEVITLAEAKEKYGLSILTRAHDEQMKAVGQHETIEFFKEKGLLKWFY